MKNRRATHPHLRAIVAMLSLAFSLRAAVPIDAPGPASTLFALTVDGADVPVVAFKDIHYAHVAVGRAARAEVRLLRGAPERARVQPSAFNIGAAITGSCVRFDIPRPLHLVVQADFLPKLFIFADPPAEPAPAGAVDAAEAGARGDGVTDNTRALQSAIDALPRGGALLLPAGHFRSGSLRLRSDMTLHLAPGALLHALDDHTKIGPLPGAPSMLAFLAADGVTNLTLSGYGTVDANGYAVRRACEKAENIKKKAGRALIFKNARNVAVRGITVRDSYSWNVDAQFVDRLSLSRVKILSDVRLSNHDGIDLESCCDATVEDCFIFSEDDGLSPKARPGRDVVENLTFRNCVIWAHKANGVRVGSESACGTMRHLLFENLYILNCEDGLRLDTTEGAVFEDVTFRNVWMEDFLEYYDERFARDRERKPIHPSRSIVFYVTRSEKRGAFTPLGRIRTVTFENVHWNDARVPAAILLPEATKAYARQAQALPLIEGVRFRGCTRAGVPLRAPSDAGLRASDAPYAAPFLFE